MGWRSLPDNVRLANKPNMNTLAQLAPYSHYRFQREHGKISPWISPWSSETYDMILVIVDWLTKYSHILPIQHPFTAAQVAKVSLDNVVKLHGVPHSIVSDQDRVFTSIFWHKLFQSVGTKLHYSMTYHPPSDG